MKIDLNESKYIVARVRKHDSWVATKKARFQKVDQYYKGDESKARRFKDLGSYSSKIFFNVGREIVEAYYPRYIGDFFNVVPGESFIKVYPSEENTPEAVNAAKEIEYWLFYRLESMKFLMRLYDPSKWVLMYGMVAGIVSRMESVKNSNKILDKFPVFRGIHPGKYSIDDGAEFKDDAIDECRYFNLSLLELTSLAQDPRFADDFDPAVISDLRRVFEQSAENTIERNIQICEWWGKLSDRDEKGKKSGGSQIYQAWVLKNKISGSKILFFKKDPYKTGKSPFVFSRFERRPGTMDGEGIFELIYSAQDALNEIKNCVLDSLYQSVMARTFHHPGVFPDNDKFSQWRPYQLCMVSSGEPINNAVFRDVPSSSPAIGQSMQIAQQLEQGIQQRASMSGLAMGQAAGPGTPPSAEEIQSRMGSLAQQFSFNFNTFVKEYVGEAAEQILIQDREIALGLSLNGEKQKIMTGFNSDGIPEFRDISLESLRTPVKLSVVGIDPGKIHTKQLMDFLQQSIMPFVDKINESLAPQGKEFNFEELFGLICSFFPSAGKLNLIREKKPITPPESADQVPGQPAVDVNAIPPAEQLMQESPGKTPVEIQPQ